MNRLVQKDSLKTILWSATHTRLGPIMDSLSPYLQMLQFFLMRGTMGVTQYRNAVRKIGKYRNTDRVENRRNTDTAFMIGQAYFNVVSISRVFLISRACIHQKSTDSSPVVSLEKGEKSLSFLKRGDWGRVREINLSLREKT